MVNRGRRAGALLALIAGIALTSIARGDGEAVSSAVGVLRLGSAPIRCTVIFGGNRYEKTAPVLTLRNVPQGEYEVVFVRGDRSVKKTVLVRDGETAILFGDLTAGGQVVDFGAPDEDAPPPADEAGAGEAPPPADIPLALPTPEQARTRQGLWRSVEDANDLYDLAERLRKAVNPLLKARRYDEAERLYKKILRRWPDSDKVELCHFRLGNIYESLYRQQFEAAVASYENVLACNPRTTLEARWRIAEIYDHQLKEYGKAIAWYDRAAEASASADIRKRAGVQAAKLRAKRGEAPAPAVR